MLTMNAKNRTALSALQSMSHYVVRLLANGRFEREARPVKEPCKLMSSDSLDRSGL